MIPQCYPCKTVWKQGQSGNAKGRPRVGDSLAARVRATVDPDELIAAVVAVMRDPYAKAADRLRAAELLGSRGWGTPPSTLTIDATVTPAASANEAPAAVMTTRRLRTAIGTSVTDRHDRATTGCTDSRYVVTLRPTVGACALRE